MDSERISWISCNKACGLLKLGPHGLKALIKAGKLTSWQVPGTRRLLVDSAQVEKLRAQAFQPAKVKAAS